MCVNVFSGYYITDKHTVSLIPFKEKFVYPGNKIAGNVLTATYKPSGQGNGGNFAGLAAEAMLMVSVRWVSCRLTLSEQRNPTSPNTTKTTTTRTMPRLQWRRKTLCRSLL